MISKHIKRHWPLYTALTLLLLIIGVIAYLVYPIFIYDRFAPYTYTPIDRTPSADLRPTAEYLYISPQPTPQGMDYAPHWIDQGRVCFATTTDARIGVEVYVNGSRLSLMSYGRNGMKVVSRDPQAYGACIDMGVLWLADGLHLFERRLMQQGQAPQIYQWAVKMENGELK